MVLFGVKLCCVLFMMVMSPMHVNAAPEEDAYWRKLLPWKQESDFTVDASNGGFRFPFFGRRSEVQEETPEREISDKEQQGLWQTVISHTDTEDLPAAVLSDVKSGESTPGEASQKERKVVFPVKLPAEVKPDVQPLETFPSTTTTAIEDQDVDQISAEVKTDEEVTTATDKPARVEKPMPEEPSTRSKREDMTTSKRIQEESAVRETQTVETLTSEAVTRRPPVDSAEDSQEHGDNKSSHHISHNLKIVTWTLAGVCLTLVVVGNFLGVYFSYIKPRMSRSTSL